jgi:hypothetical protein
VSRDLLRLALVRSLSMTNLWGLRANALRKVVGLFLKGGRAQVLKGFCPVCGKRPAVFLGSPRSVRESYWCLNCCSSTRNRHVAYTILRLFTGGGGSLAEWARHKRPRLTLWHLQAQGPLHWALKSLDGYVGTEYLPNRPSGATLCGIRIEDATGSTFRDASFDLVISEDVLEHVVRPRDALREIRRVLREGGSHVFSVPLHEGTTEWWDGRVVPFEYHSDPLGGRAAVFTRFGKSDICRILEREGFEAELDEVEIPEYCIRQTTVILARKKSKDEMEKSVEGIE